jgi:hypothetical protein
VIEHPDVYPYLADRYWRLALHYEKRGRSWWARHLGANANHCRDLGGGPPLPPAAGLATPLPRRPNFIAAIGFDSDTPPDDAA